MSWRLPPAAGVALLAASLALSATAIRGRDESTRGAGHELEARASAQATQGTPPATPPPSSPNSAPAQSTAPAAPAESAAPAQGQAAPAPSTAPAAAPQTPGADAPNAARGGDADKKKDDKKDEKPRKGLPVTEPLILAKCAGCHFDLGEKKLSRISFLRKTPEAWELSVKRMLRMQNVQLTPDEAKQIVRYLANDHGLARGEAQRAMYEVERRIHWSEAEADKDLRSTCGECHTLGRVLSERRDADEWKLLKATHLAFFPLAQWQAFAGDGGGFEGIDWESMSESEAEAEFERRRSEKRADRADKVLDKLAKDLPLFTPEWDHWSVNRRTVPLAGAWDVTGHEVGRGDVRGVLAITATGKDEYTTEWTLSVGGAAELVRKGKGVLYAGFQWRGKTETTSAGEEPELREALLLSEDWNELRGRLFTGEYSEVGLDVTLRRRTALTGIASIDDAAVAIPSSARVLDVRGSGFPAALAAADFHAGEGVTITAAERVDDGHVRLTVDVDRKAKRGARELSFRAVRGDARVVLYDSIDWIRVAPELGLARVGGKMRPPQTERFEAVAMNRGEDDELYTADDYAVKVVPATWTIEEFPVRENDDDAQFVGAIDARTGRFTPALDGPNPARRWSANNIGEVYVVATCRLATRETPVKPKPAKKAEAKPEGGQDAAPPAAEAPKEDDAPIRIVEKEFRSHGRLLVMVPLYIDWNRFQWDKR
ncbi:MAG: quinohemoprotein amine dehydrogenase subunit alpha [Planctomycetes bacterium]|nr:quinohemoprotein amine dehydrogenase subunit alpha [Planctomycetota bacterium]